MYDTFFGFRERPFKLVPTPAYLYLSRSHEEALAHLKYAIAQEEGFVEITGEVGTGKTMLCRVFLENLPSEVETAYIFNPRMNARGLLQSINDEFGIRSDGSSTKELIDALNTFLMRKRAAGRRAVLVIDEAQNLDRDVLEQLRLLSNLETVHHKLLQIILVGQPELSEMLDAHELRQLAQRVSLSCRLCPLNAVETGRYISHRIHVASRTPGAVSFTRPALRWIYKFSGGIPRLINIVCDRTLLLAFNNNTKKINSRTVRQAIAELSNRQLHTPVSGRKASVVPALVLAALVVAFAGIVFYQFDRVNVFGIQAGEHNGSNEERIAPTRAKARPEDSEALSLDLPVRSAEAEISPWRKDLEELIRTIGPDSGISAMSYLLSLWHIDVRGLTRNASVDKPEAFFQRMSEKYGFELYTIERDLELLRKTDLPAILSFSGSKMQKRAFLTVVAANKDTLTFYYPRTEGFYRVPIEAVGALWTGKAYVLWENPRGINGVIGVDARALSVAELQLLLRDIGMSSVKITGTYDAATQTAVRRIQAEQGLVVDGKVGPLTKIILYRLHAPVDMPRIARRSSKDS
ncbi:MAG: AAA family ATPase [Desulfobacterales bacterium]|nr:AAA family ATPase [Desulfobacterales bacterium]MBS3755021.1 AAA family ATPase [Desulfobacterales bacterium]